MSAIRLKDVTLGYEGHPAVHHLDGTFEDGSLTAIVGPNGSGKSTLLKGIVGMLQPLTGSIERAPGATIAYLPQSADIDRTFPATVADLVALGHWRRRGLFAAITGADYRQVEEALATVGLTGFENRPLDTLSGGQLQRALFARVMLQDADTILLDEPFTAIDEKTVIDLIELVRRWHAEDRTVIAVLHDAEMVKAVFPRTLLMAREPVCWADTDKALKAENLLKARRMTEAWDEHAPWHENGHGHGGGH
ncbi:ABC transporter [Devosia sp. H5989]|nr:ABC transporter [Devosia sp. H5989]